MIRGQACPSDLMEQGVLPERLAIINVEGACATGSLAFQLACKDVLSSQTDLALAIGVEKLYDPSDPQKVLQEIAGGFDRFDDKRWIDEYETWRGAPKSNGHRPRTARSRWTLMACKRAYHMRRYGTTREQIAIGAAKNHTHGSLNPKAQYRFPMTKEQVLADRPVSGPLTRAMCAPIGDGAAAAIVCSKDRLATFPDEVRRRAVRIRASAAMIRKNIASPPSRATRMVALPSPQHSVTQLNRNRSVKAPL